MTFLTKDLLASLIKENYSETCVSIFIPTAQAGKEVVEGSIRLKNLLKTAKGELEKEGISAKNIEELLKPAYDLVENSMFWSYQRDGLWIFINSEGIDYYRLPIKFRELVVVSKGLYIQPLLQLFSKDGEFYVLALSQQKVRLIHCTQYTSKEINLDALPSNMSDALGYDTDSEKQLQHRVGGSDRNDIMYHGHGTGNEEHKKDIHKFLQLINAGLPDYIKSNNAPIVLAGVDYILSIFRKMNTYNNILDKGMLGNADELSPVELQRKAWEIVSTYFDKPLQESIIEYDQKKGSAEVCNDIKKIVNYAYNGQIKILFITSGIHQWGAYDPTTSSTQLYGEKLTDSIDLLNFAAIHTFLNGGNVYEVTKEEIPKKSLLCSFKILK
ncbi:baeRF7 domain-containing protein [Alkaliphilus peptidifermentans]|uniref:Uncharacterized protein n=1 Tax=Alkaliphilus peptidifermentans DSM 18978 TaxID=1120976 RepID=A0A1G5JS58_9FIRM|nr:hypothetical protein [Alkaliphilus peptidifermentans]SCY90741.1 hypothetical protein SAMN03080606_02985 [Alkaliphilus peptidifermentans DSM 18978]